MRVVLPLSLSCQKSMSLHSNRKVNEHMVQRKRVIDSLEVVLPESARQKFSNAITDTMVHRWFPYFMHPMCLAESDIAVGVTK